MESKVFENAAKLLFPRKRIIIESLKIVTPQQFPPTARVVLIKQLGIGANATVHLAEELVTRQQYAVRVLKTSTMSRQTTATQLILANYLMAPRVYYIGKVLVSEKHAQEQYSIVFMDYILGTLDALSYSSKIDFRDSMRCLLDKKYLLNFLHGDMHTDNIVVLKDGKTLGFIDFDFSYFGVPQKLNFLDFIPLLGSLKNSRAPTAPALIALLLAYYKEKFNISINMTLVRDKKNGGYEYAGMLNSYLAMDRTFFPKIDSVFPNLHLPKIVS